jgi:eukaryotic-like serine/threonine-protein kinase
MVRFGPFELDSRAGELRKHGIRIKLKLQGVRILLMLLERPGEVVLREEIQRRLWPDDTVVEFDHGINAAIQKLRDALGETAAEPQYIETLPRRGYRFVGTVEAAPPVPTSPPEPPRIPEGSERAAARAYRSHVARVWSPPVAIAGAALIAGMMISATWVSPFATRAPVSNWVVSLGAIGNAEFSPNGSSVVYSTPRGLMMRRMDSLEESAVYTENLLGDYPVWSPDGSQLLFRTIPDLTRLPLANGSPTIIWPQVGVTRGYAWAPDGTVLVAVLVGNSGGRGLWVVPSTGGKPTRLDLPDAGGFFWPEFLPDGKNFLVARETAEEPEVGIYLATLNRGKITRGPILLRKNTTAGHYSPSAGGRLLYVQSDKLYAQNLNVGRGRLEGEPERVVDGVFSNVYQRRAGFSVSRNGALLWRAGRAGVAQLTWFDRSGRVLGTAGPPCLPEKVQLSRDEKHILAYTVAEHGGPSVIQPTQNGYVALSGVSKFPVWMPDSSHILYIRRDGSTSELMKRAVEGGTETLLARVPHAASIRDVSADGKVALYRGEGTTLYSVRLDSAPEEAKPQLVAASVQGNFSPDGRWVVYGLSVNNNSVIYVQPFPSGGLPIQISTGGESPVWRADGKEILYHEGPTIYSVRVEAKGNTIHASRPAALFKVRLPAGIVGDSMPMAVTRDGSRILFAQGVEQPNPQVTNVMTAWDQSLRR